MILLGYSLKALASIIGGIISFVELLIIARVIISWIEANPYNTLVRIVVQATDPIFKLFGKRRLICGAIDFTPLVILIILAFIGQAIAPALADYGQGMIIRAKSIGIYENGYTTSNNS